MSAQRIRFLIPSLSIGGSERACVLLANEIQALGYSVEVLTARSGGEFRSKLAPAIHLAEAGASRLLWALPFLAFRLRRHACPTWLFGFDLGIFGGWCKKYHIVGSRLFYREGSLPSRNIPAEKLNHYGRFINLLDGITVQTEAGRQEMLKLGVRRPKLEVVGNIVNFEASAAKSFAGDVHLLFVGRLSPEKGLRRLLLAFERADPIKHRLKLRIVGHGPEAARLEELAGSLSSRLNIELVGSTMDTLPHFVWAHIILNCSVYEGLPNALLEGIAAGCKVLCTRACPSIQELMEKLGMEDACFPDEEFDYQFFRCVQSVMRISDSAYQEAVLRLKAMCGASVIARRYLGITEGRC